MHYILFGDDDFSRDEALKSITESLDDNDFKDANVTVLDGNTIGIDQLIHTCNTTPFLSSKRTVIVKNLVSTFLYRPVCLAASDQTAPSRQIGAPGRSEQVLPFDEAPLSTTALKPRQGSGPPKAHRTPIQQGSGIGLP